MRTNEIDAADALPPDEYLPPSVAELPPTAKLVYRALVVTDAETQPDLAETTGTSQRSVRNALGQLEERGAVEARTCLTDTRVRLYTVATAEESDGS